MLEFYPIFGKKKLKKICHFLHFCWRITLDGKNTVVGFQRQKEEVRSPPKYSMKFLFNPYKNVGVYVENVNRTFLLLPIFNEKKGMIFRCVLMPGQRFCLQCSGCLHVEHIFLKI